MEGPWKTAIKEHLIAVNSKPSLAQPVVKLSREEKIFFSAVFLVAAIGFWLL